MERIDTFHQPTSDFSGIWSREWLEWWSLTLIGLAFFWAWYNPKKSGRRIRPDGLLAVPRLINSQKKEER